MFFGGANERIGVAERQERLAPDFFVVAWGMNLNVATQQLDGVAINGLFKAANQAIVHQ